MRHLGVISFAALLIVCAIVCSGCGAGVAASPNSDTGSVTINASAQPASIQAGTIAVLRWSTTNAETVSIDPAPVTDDNLPPSWPVNGSVNITPRQTVTYVFGAKGARGSAVATVIVNVSQVTPTLTLRAQPEAILAGETSRLTWAAESATAVNITPGIGDVSSSGSVTVTPASTTTYIATAIGPGGSTTASITISVAAANELGISITASPVAISQGLSTLLTWKSQNAVTVSIDNGIGPVPATGAHRVTPAETTTYVATAAGASGNTRTASIQVAVVQSGTIGVVKHVIFMSQENRSFDHYFGNLGRYRALKGLPASDVDGLDLQRSLLDRNGVAVLPYRMQSVCHENLTPDWDPAHVAVNGGAMDGFMKHAYLPSNIDPNYHRAMAYFDERDIPYYYELATQFATSDRFFTSVMSGTIPNRTYLLAATSVGRAVYPDWPGSATETNPTIFDRLDDANVDWRYYHQDQTVHLGWYTTINKPTTPPRVLPLDQLFTVLASANADEQLAPVVFIQHGPQIGTDEHPGGPSLQIGAALVKRIIDALMASNAWSSSVFILTYDEYGGFQDHVAPVPAPPPDDILPRLGPTNFQAAFEQTGLRVPLLVVSPWVKPHYVSHVPREFTSILKLIETRFALPPLTRRDLWADDMTEMFDFSRPGWLVPPPMPAQPTNGMCDWQLEIPK